VPLKLVAFGLVFLAVLALPAAAATPDTRSITVVGNGEAEPESVPGDWTLVVSIENERAGIALRNARAAVARTESALRAAGVGDFHTGRMSLNARPAQDQSGSIRGFVASTQIELALPDVRRAATLLDRARLAGVTQIHGPVASEEASRELTRRALENGFDDAVEKARRLAAKAGVTLGAVLTIEERVNQVPSFPAIVYGPGGPIPRFAAPSDDVYADVTVTFAVS
jgi:uncharacterized protein YggE